MHHILYRSTIPVAFFMIYAVMLATSAYAQYTGSTTPEDRPEASQEQRPAIREERQGMRNSLPQQTQNRVRNLVTNVIDRLTAALNRMESIITRLDSRITKMSAEGFDTTAASAKLTESKESLSRARDMLAKIPPIGEVMSGERPRIAYQEVRTQLIAVRAEIVKIHGLLRETIALLKGTTTIPQEEATTTEPLPAQ